MKERSLRLDEAVAERTGVSRSRARSLIIAGRVSLAGRPMTKPGADVSADAARTHDDAENLAQRLFCPLSGDVFGGCDKHVAPLSNVSVITPIGRPKDKTIASLCSPFSNH